MRVRQYLARWFWAIAAASGVCPGEPMPAGYFRGNLVSVEGTAEEGVLVARADDGGLFDCAYDSKSYLEFSKQRVAATRLVAGDRLDVLSDRSGRGRGCYIRILHVLPPEPSRTRAAKAQRPLARLTPVVTATLSGIVVRNQDGLLTIRTRESQETVLVRRDTRFIGDGLRGEASSLGMNQRVFIQAGRNLDGELEAYQVTWGGILTVR